MSEQWTDWTDHDGKGFPADLVNGMYVASRHDNGKYIEAVYDGDGKMFSGSWDWSNYPTYTKILRYRIRKPDALQQMIELAEALPVVKQLEVTE